MKIKLLSILTLLLVITSCNRNGIPKEFDYGNVENGTYSNEFFGFTMKVPSKWYLLTEDEQKELTDRGAERITERNTELKETIEASKVNTAQMISMFKYPVDSMIAFNPSVLVIAENLSMTPQIKTSGQYLDEAQKMVDKMQMGYEFPDGAYVKHDFGGEKFESMRASIDNLFMTVNQEYIVTIKNGFALIFIMSYSTEEEKSELYSVMKTIKFK